MSVENEGDYFVEGDFVGGHIWWLHIKGHTCLQGVLDSPPKFSLCSHYRHTLCFKSGTLLTSTGWHWTCMYFKRAHTQHIAHFTFLFAQTDQSEFSLTFKVCLIRGDSKCQGDIFLLFVCKITAWGSFLTQPWMSPSSFSLIPVAEEQRICHSCHNYIYFAQRFCIFVLDGEIQPWLK